MLKEVGDDPSAEKVKEYVVKTLDSGVSVMTASVLLGILLTGKPKWPTNMNVK